MSLIESPLASEDASLNQAFVINPDDIPNSNDDDDDDDTSPKQKQDKYLNLQ